MDALWEISLDEEKEIDLWEEDMISYVQMH